MLSRLNLTDLVSSAVFVLESQTSIQMNHAQHDWGHKSAKRITVIGFKLAEKFLLILDNILLT